MNIQLPKIRVMIVDDSAMLRERLAQLLAETHRTELVGEVADAPEAMARIRALNPQVVILDIRLPNGNGVQILRDIKRELPATVVIILTNYPQEQYRKPCMAAGANYFFDKSMEFNKITTVIESLTATPA